MESFDQKPKHVQEKIRVQRVQTGVRNEKRLLKVLKALADHTPARHPSQLYEGILEGLLVFLVLYILRIMFPRLWHGVISGVFFILYAVFRIGVENVREPDAEKILGVTKGQFYSFFMIGIGIAFLAYAWRSKKSLSST